MAVGVRNKKTMGKDYSKILSRYNFEEDYDEELDNIFETTVKIKRKKPTNNFDAFDQLYEENVNKQGKKVVN